jgi:phytoene desaturase
VVGVETKSSSYDCDAIVINADFAQAMNKLVPNHLRSRWSDKNLERKQYSCSTFMMYLGVEGSYPEQMHHTIHIANDYQKNLREIEIEKVLPEDPSIYIQNPCITDPSMAPKNQSSLYVLVPVPHVSPNTPWDAAQTAFYREKTLSKMENLGFSDIRKRIVYEKVVTPADWRDDFFVYRGATFNLAHNLGQMLHLRPHNKFEELDGGTHPGSGLPVIYESSRITCNQLIPSLGLQRRPVMVGR